MNRQGIQKRLLTSSFRRSPVLLEALNAFRKSKKPFKQ
jgi:hypothetical protein